MGACLSRLCAGDGRAAASHTSHSFQEEQKSSDNDQVLLKRAPGPHKFREIIAEELANASNMDSAAAALEAQVYSTEIFLAQKTKKYWVEQKTVNNCFMLFSRGLSITWGEDPRYWRWNILQETSDTDIEVASLQYVCWLEIHGKFDISYLTPGVTYEFVFVVMLDEAADGWHVPVTLRLKTPDGAIQQHKENLQEKPRGQWLELTVGELTTKAAQQGEVEISLLGEGDHWKKGLIFKGVIIRPKK